MYVKFNLEVYTDLFLRNIPADESVAPHLLFISLDGVFASEKVQEPGASQSVGIHHAEQGCDPAFPRSRAFIGTHHQLISPFFTHYYHGQWSSCLSRLFADQDDFMKAVETELKPYPSEMIRDVIKEKNEIVAVRAAKYDMTGRRVIYDGYWTNHTYNIFGELHLGIKFSEKDKSNDYPDSSAVLYKGEFCMGVRNGRGEERDGHGWLLYEGRFRDNKYDGEGKLYYPLGNVRYEGHFVRGKYDGKGREYDFTGMMKYDGHYKEGKQYKEGHLYLAPHYFQEVKNYGEKNRQEEELYYHRLENCNLEDLNYGDRNKMKYTNEIFDLIEENRLPCPLREEKAYICKRIKGE